MRLAKISLISFLIACSSSHPPAASLPVDRLQLIGDECPAHAGSFAMTQRTARAVMTKEIEREAACKKAIESADSRTAKERQAHSDTLRTLQNAQWWQLHGIGVAAIAATIVGALCFVGGFSLGENIRR